MNLRSIFCEYSLMDDQGHSDIVDMLAAEPGSVRLGWRLLGDGIRHYNEGNYREAVINCCSSVEVEVTPALQEWLSEKTVTGARDHIVNATKEMGNPLRFEVFFKSIADEALTIYPKAERLRMLEDLKSMNATRNKVVHEGRDATGGQAESAVSVSGRLLRALWIRGHGFWEGLVKRYP